MPGAEPSATMPLAATFPPQTHERWQALVAGVVNKSRAEEARLTPEQAEASLRSTLPGGLVIDPLYVRPATATGLGVPARMPFTRGRAVREPGASWDVRQLHDDPEADATRAAVLDDLEHGVTSVWVHVGADGLAPADLGHALADVRLDLAPVVVSATDDQAGAAAALLAILRTTPGASGNLGLDPIGAAARLGSAPELAGLADAVEQALAQPGIAAITIDARIYRDAGASAPDEIACAIATGVSYLRALDAAGIEPATAFPQIAFRISATADQFLTTAAIRALRRVWARVGAASAVPTDLRGAHIHAVTALRMFSRDDPWVNVLRSTLAVFGASVGGADAISVLPYDTVAGLPEKFSRRLARNTQLLLADESNIARVTDPAGGSWYVESLTEQVAQAAWAAFQEIEQAGGMPVALAEGVIAARIATTHEQDARALATRRQPLTGVSMFPLAAEAPLTRVPRAVLTTAAGALVPRRDAQAYEILRDRARAYAARHGAPPSVPIVALGTRRDYGAREMFVTNLLAAGGIEHVTHEGGLEPGMPPPRVVVLASSPAGYAAHGAAAVAAVRAAGVGEVLIAGRSRELGGLAVDGELYDGIDVVAALSALLERLGAPAEGDLA